MSAYITSVRTKGEKTPLVIISVKVGEENSKYTVTEGTYRKIGCPLSGEVIDEEAVGIIAKEDEKRRALQKALSILAYSDNNEKRLYTKLCMAGFGREIARATVVECVNLGYINEERQLERLIVKYNRELLGPRKIIAKLIGRGYSQKAAVQMISRLQESDEISFEESARILIETKLPEGASSEERRKLLYKYGYSYG